MEMAIFIVFVTLQFSAKYLPLVFKKAARFVIIQRLSRYHWVVWLSHPAIWHGLHDYAIHLTVYSGYFFQLHH